ncbi:MAG: hypothetical protein JO347_10520, partial [Candidatus Eremiobacteraeota bacterium]|nr:hypothetical protein [Candidatus Eremiobacteraeota bacterium]
PRSILGGGPLRAWEEARAAGRRALVPEALDQIVDVGTPFGALPLGRFLAMTSVLDTLAHTWDVAAAAGIDVAVEPHLVAAAHGAAAALGLPRGTPGGIKPALIAPPGASPFVNFLAFIGRKAW